LGTSLALALSASQATVMGHTARTPESRSKAEVALGIPSSSSIAALVRRALGSGSSGQGKPTVFLVTVPDALVAEVAAELAHEVLATLKERPDSAEWFAVHTSGATPVAALGPCADAGAVTLSLHPLQTFSDPVRGAALLQGAAVAVTPGPDPEHAPTALAFGLGLAALIGGRPFALKEEHRVLYHAAATVASNYLITLEHAAERLFEAAGLPEAEALSAFLPLVRGAVDNLEAQGTLNALTGPLSRGDARTVAAHLNALTTEAPDLVGLYRVLGSATLGLVRARGDLPPSTIEALERTMNIIAERTPDSITGDLTIATRSVSFSTQGEGDVVDLTDHLNRALRETGLAAGTMTVFAPGATGAVTTLEFEPGVVHDFKQLFARIVPADDPYRHNLLLSDGNGHSHVRAGLLGPSLVVPFNEGRLTLGTWQEVVFVCFDNRPRDRKVVVQIMGVAQ
jgi:secondary thiamine-phosphate synthase enzyme